MGGYKLTIKPTALAELEKVPKKVARLLVEKIKSLSLNPRPYGCKKLSGAEKYRLRQGSYRIVYRIHDVEKVVDVVKVAHRSSVYRGFK